jgi:hypothetical protein
MIVFWLFDTVCAMAARIEEVVQFKDCILVEP